MTEVETEMVDCVKLDDVLKDEAPDIRFESNPSSMPRWRASPGAMRI